MAPAQLIEAKDLPPELQPRAARARAGSEPRAAAATAPDRAPCTAPAVAPAASPRAAPPQRRRDPGATRRRPIAGWLSGLEREARELLAAPASRWSGTR